MNRNGYFPVKSVFSTMRILLLLWLSDCTLCQGFMFSLSACADSVEYPLAMDFRHLHPDTNGTYDVFSGNSVILSDLIHDDDDCKLEYAREYKAIHTNTIVLVQVNSDPMGLSGSTYTVPSEEAGLLGLHTNHVPSASFKGHWLYRVGSIVQQNIASTGTTQTVAVVDSSWFNFQIDGNYPAAVLYRTVAGTPDWDTSEYVTITGVDTNQNTVSFERWSTNPWNAYSAGEAYLAPSAGDIYENTRYWSCKGLSKTFRTFAPNFTKFCPEDSSGVDAAEWYAEFLADLWNNEVAAYSPVLDGYQIDASYFKGGYAVSSHIGAIDCDNDGQPDDCQFNGVNYWGLGIHRFIHLLRNGSGSFQGIGTNALVLFDCSAGGANRSYSLLNGAENEEFTSYGSAFTQEMNTYLLWCQESLAPHRSYLQMRGDSDTYVDSYSPESFGNEDVRMGMASAMMGDGVFTYRTGGLVDRDSITLQDVPLDFWWDEYYAGDKNKPNWLGAPVGDPVRPKIWGNSFFPDCGFENGLVGSWVLNSSATHTVSGPSVVTDPDKGKVLKVTVSDFSERWSLASCVNLQCSGSASVTAGQEYVLSFWLRTDNLYGSREGSLYDDIGLGFTVSVSVNGEYYPVDLYRLQSCSDGFVYHLTVIAPQTGIPTVQFRFGSELGDYYIDDFVLRLGCAEVMYRPFENGIVLLNGSSGGGFDFNLDTYTPGIKYRRLYGSQYPSWHNNGSVASSPFGLTRQNAIFLIKRNAFLFDTDDDAEGWYALNGVTGFSVSGGTMSYTAVSGGFIRTGSLLSQKIDCRVFDRIRIRLKNQTSCENAVFYFITDETAAWAGQSFSVQASDNDFTEYEVDMSAHSGWHGDLEYLRLDLPGSSGDVAIDWIEIE